MENFFNSNLFQSLVALVVGLVAFAIYFKQKSDYKKDAASSILLEIQNAERIIPRIKESIRNGHLEIDVIVMPSNSWERYKHLFVRNFDRDEWDAITEFYNKARLLDGAIRFNNSAFMNDAEQIRINRQRILADLANEILKRAEQNPNADVSTELKTFNDKLDIFDKLYMDKQGQFSYKPMKPLNDAKLYLEDWVTLTTTSVGAKLKRLTKT